MNSPWSADDVLDALGDKFLSALAGSVQAARIDLAEMRVWKPEWFPTMHARCLSNLIHDRIWAHLAKTVRSDNSAVVIDDGQVRELQVGANYLLRIKRHRGSNRISTYATQGALGFYAQGNQIPLSGLELITLAGGYRWDEDLREIMAPVVSYRDGKDNPIWAVELDEPQDGTGAVRRTPIILPSLPTIDFGQLDATGETGSSDGA